MRLFAFLCIMPSLVVAGSHDVYRWVAPDGTVHYSDRPHEGAEVVTVESAPPAATSHEQTLRPPDESQVSAPHKYERLTVIKPRVGETIRSNQGTVEILVAVKPALVTDEGHKIRISLNGHVVGSPASSLKHALSGLERGEHAVSAAVVDEQGRVLIKSKHVAFYMKHASVLFHPPRPDTPRKGLKQAPRAPMARRAPRAPHAPFVPAPAQKRPKSQ
jgi:hypothetical protein